MHWYAQEDAWKFKRLLFCHCYRCCLKLREGKLHKFLRINRLHMLSDSCAEVSSKEYISNVFKQGMHLSWSEERTDLVKSHSCKRSRSILYAVAISPSADVTIFNTENLISSYNEARNSLLNSSSVLPRLANLQFF